jgi:hypothetical protein
MGFILKRVAGSNQFFYLLIYTLILWSCSKPEQELNPPTNPTTDKSYYVSPNGNDANPGTKEKPFRTLEKINEIVLNPGESIYLEGGKTFTGTLILDTNDIGSFNKPIKISSYGNGNPTIEGNKREAVIIKSNYFQFSNINAIGAGYKNGNETHGISILNSAGGHIENVLTEGFNKSGLYVFNSKNIELIKVTARLNGFSGIYITGDTHGNGELLTPGKRLSRNIYLKECKAENNPGDPSFTTNHSGSGIFIESTDKALIEYCTATNNGWEMGSETGPIGIWTALSDSVTIQYCISYGE